MSSGQFLCTCIVLFGMGAQGTFQNRRNFLIMLLCIEVMLLSVNLVFQTGSVTVDDMNGQLLALWVLTAAAAETAQGQALCVLYFRLRSTLGKPNAIQGPGQGKRLAYTNREKLPEYWR